MQGCLGISTDTPSDAPSNLFTFSPIAIASTSSVVGGIAGPEDILTVAAFERILKEETERILGVPSPSAVLLVRALKGTMHVARALETDGCEIEVVAVQFDGSSDVCIKFSTANELDGVLFCYRFQIIVGAGTGDDCDVNEAAELLITAMKKGGGFENAIGPVSDAKIVQSAPTTSPSSKPSVSPSNVPSNQPSTGPSVTAVPTALSSSNPSDVPSTPPSSKSSLSPSNAPSNAQSDHPSTGPSVLASSNPSSFSSSTPSTSPSAAPTFCPSGL